MTAFPTFTLFLLCFVPVVACTWIGVRWGRRVAPHLRPESGHLGTVQGALLGLLGLMLGFAFSNAMSRFTERQSALYSEANAIETAYDRAELLPTRDQLRAILREYADLRLQLFHTSSDGPHAEIEARIQERYDAALAACMEGVREAPGLANLELPGVEAINDEFDRRMALARRHMPMEFVIVMLICSAMSLGAIGYGAGLVERRSMGVTMCLAVLTATALFITFDFDRPRRGLIRLDPAPLLDLARKLNATR
ncbi:MAG: hypothetical protein IT434_04350 [Phycisphaerales bacterium]|jgi:hypothetical protein|nr:hypothetical protein [Phycisphaerales bacterium]